MRFEQGLRGGFSGVSHGASRRMDTIRGTSGQPGMGRGQGPRLTAWWAPMRTGKAASCYTSHTLPAEQFFFFHLNMGNNILKSKCGLSSVLLGKWMGPWGYINPARLVCVF